MLKVIKIIFLVLVLYNIAAKALEKDNYLINNKISNSANNEHIKKNIFPIKEENTDNTANTNVTTKSEYRPSLFFNNSIFSGDNNGDDNDDDDDKKNRLYKANDFYYNCIPSTVKDIDVIILLVDGLVAFLSSADTNFDENYNEFIERLYLVMFFIQESASEKYSNKIAVHICNRISHEFQVFIYSQYDIFLKNLTIDQKKKIINALPKRLNLNKNNEEYYQLMEEMKNVMQKLIVGFIWVNDLSNLAVGELVIDTDKIIDAAKVSKIPTIKNLPDEIYANRAFFQKNKNIHLGCLRKDSKKYKKKFLDSDLVHKVNLKTKIETEDPVTFISDLFRKTINKRLIEQKSQIQELPDGATNVINIIAKGFNLQKIMLFLEKIKSSEINKYLVALDDTTNIAVNKFLNQNQTDNAIIFFQLNIKEVLISTILQQIKNRVSRKNLAEILVEVLSEEVNEIIYQLKIFSRENMQPNDDIISISSSSSGYSASSDKSEEYSAENLSDLLSNIARFLYSVSDGNVSNDRILFFLDMINEEDLYYLADKVGIEYNKFNRHENTLQNKKKLLIKILRSDSDNKGSKTKAQVLFDRLSIRDKIKINNYFKDIYEGAQYK